MKNSSFATSFVRYLLRLMCFVVAFAVGDALIVGRQALFSPTYQIGIVALAFLAIVGALGLAVVARRGTTTP